MEKGINVTKERFQRFARSDDIRKKRRNQLSLLKRRQNEIHSPYSCSDVEQALLSLSNASSDATSEAICTKSEAICKMRRWIMMPRSDQNSVHEVLNVTSNLAVELSSKFKLTCLLVPFLIDGGKDALDSVKCISNLSYDLHLDTSSALIAVPSLATLLNSADTELQEYSAWALGNMAEHSEQLREAVKNQQVVSVLTALVANEGVNCNVRRASAWTLSNLCRGQQVLAMPFITMGVHVAMLNVLFPKEILDDAALGAYLIGSGERVEISTEAAWILSLLSSREASAMYQMLEDGLLNRIIPLLHALVKMSPAKPSFTVPSLHILINAVTKPGFFRHSVHVARLLQSDSLAMMRDVVSPHMGDPSIVKEGLCVINSLLGIADICENHHPHLKTLLEGSVLSSVCWQFCKASFENKAMAASALRSFVCDNANVLTRAILDRNLPRFEVLRICIEMLSENTSVDTVSTCLDIITATLKYLSNPFAAAKLGGRTGMFIIESIGGVDALETMQYSSSLLGIRASNILQKYFQPSDEIMMTDT